MQNNIPISAVIPAFNRAHIVGKAIDSALAQRHAPAEIIVVDDGSSDRTREVVESYGDRVRYVFQTNSGVSAARNRGTKESKCEWIAFLDSDDSWLPDHLGRIANAIETTRGEAALYFSDTQRPREDGGSSFWQLCGLQIDGEVEFKRDAGDWVLMPIHPMMLQASVIRRETYLEVGGLPEQLRTREDTFLFLKLALRYPACAVSGCGTVMNSNDNIRLSRVYGSESVIYWDATIFLYQELIDSLTEISRARRRFLVDSLSISYFSMGRVSFRHKQYFKAVKHLSTSCITSPSVFAKELFLSSKRNLLKTKPGSSSSPVRSGAKI
jgi:glycosyltransferase involved in cell wall biosynthesis